VDREGRLPRVAHLEDGADVVEVAVGGQDPPDLAPAPADRLEDPGGLVAGVHDDDLAALPVEHDAAVLLEGADDDGLDGEVHGRRIGPARAALESSR
jgi:hypothetical protein